MIDYSWPGNVRELSAWVERLYVTGLTPEVLMEMLRSEIEPCPSASIDLSGSLDHVERQTIVKALEQSNFNKCKAARLLQVHRATLARKLRQTHDEFLPAGDYIRKWGYKTDANGTVPYKP